MEFFAIVGSVCYLVFYRGGCVFLFFVFFWLFGGRGGRGEIPVEGFGIYFLMDGGDNVTLMSELLYSSSGRGEEETLG